MFDFIAMFDFIGGLVCIKRKIASQINRKFEQLIIWESQLPMEVTVIVHC